MNEQITNNDHLRNLLRGAGLRTYALRLQDALATVRDQEAKLDRLRKRLKGVDR